MKKVLPSVPFMPRIEQTAFPHSNLFPSWIFNFKIEFISPNETVSLASAENGTVRVYPCGFHERTSAGFCIVATDATGIVDIGERCTGWLTFFIFALKVLLFDVLSRTWSYKIE